MFYAEIYNSRFFLSFTINFHQAENVFYGITVFEYLIYLNNLELIYIYNPNFRILNAKEGRYYVFFYETTWQQIQLKHVLFIVCSIKFEVNMVLALIFKIALFSIQQLYVLSLN